MTDAFSEIIGELKMLKRLKPGSLLRDGSLIDVARKPQRDGACLIPNPRLTMSSEAAATRRITELTRFGWVLKTAVDDINNFIFVERNP